MIEKMKITGTFSNQPYIRVQNSFNSLSIPPYIRVQNPFNSLSVPFHSSKYNLKLCLVKVNKFGRITMKFGLCYIWTMDVGRR